MIPHRIAYVLKIFPKISETFIASELAELHRRGIELRILSLLPPRNEIRHEFIHRAGLEEITCYKPAEFSRIIRDFRPELLHAHFATESTAAAWELARGHGMPFTFTCHGYDIYRKPPADFAARANAAAAVITVSQANATYIARTFRIPQQRIRVIPCGVDTSRFRPPQAAGVAIRGTGLGPSDGDHTPMLLCVARLVAVKNLGLLMKACALLKQRTVHFRCVIVGEGSLRPELEAMRAELGLDDSVEMPGAADQDQVLKLWQTAAVGVLTSSSEGMPVCLMEAAACGVPVVATAVGGVPELVHDGVTGLLTSAGNPEALASRLGRLLFDPEMRKALSVAARQRSETHFSLTRQVDQLLAVWGGILQEGESTSPVPSVLAASCLIAQGRAAMSDGAGIVREGRALGGKEL